MNLLFIILILFSVLNGSFSNNITENNTVTSIQNSTLAATSTEKDVISIKTNLEPTKFDKNSISRIIQPHSYNITQESFSHELEIGLLRGLLGMLQGLFYNLQKAPEEMNFDADDDDVFNEHETQGLGNLFDVVRNQLANISKPDEKSYGKQAEQVGKIKNKLSIMVLLDDNKDEGLAHVCNVNCKNLSNEWILHGIETDNTNKQMETESESTEPLSIINSVMPMEIIDKNTKYFIEGETSTELLTESVDDNSSDSHEPNTHTTRVTKQKHPKHPRKHLTKYKRSLKHKGKHTNSKHSKSIETPNITASTSVYYSEMDTTKNTEASTSSHISSGHTEIDYSKIPDAKVNGNNKEKLAVKTDSAQEYPKQSNFHKDLLLSDMEGFVDYKNWFQQHFRAPREKSLKTSSTSQHLKKPYFLFYNGGTEQSATDALEPFESDMNIILQNELEEPSVVPYKRTKRNFEYTNEGKNIANDNVSQSPVDISNETATSSTKVGGTEISTSTIGVNTKSPTVQVLLSNISTVIAFKENLQQKYGNSTHTSAESKLDDIPKPTRIDLNKVDTRPLMAENNEMESHPEISEALHLGMENMQNKSNLIKESHSRYVGNIEQEYNDGGGIPTRPLLLIVTVPSFIGMGLLILCLCFVTRDKGWCCRLFASRRTITARYYKTAQQPSGSRITSNR